MRRRGELLESERAMLLELSLGPASVQAISQRTGQADRAVWLILARLELERYVRGDPTAGGAPRLPRIYGLTAAGRRAAGLPEPEDAVG